MAKPKDKDVLRLVAVFGATFAIIVGLTVAGIIFRSQDVEVEQTIYPLEVEVNPNSFPNLGLDNQGRANFSFELTVRSSNQNPALALTVYVIPTVVQNLSISHCIANSQPNLTGPNVVCGEGWNVGAGEYYANVTAGTFVVLKIEVLFTGPINEPSSLTWTFYAVGEEIP